MAHRLRSAGVVFVILSVLSSCATGDQTGQGNIPDDVLASGETAYKQYCLTCHLANGAGAPPMNPPLTKTSFVLGDEKALIDVVLKGMKNTLVDGERYRNVMPPFNHLSDKEIADVLTYIRNSFGNSASMITAESVMAARQSAEQLP